MVCIKGRTKLQVVNISTSRVEFEILNSTGDSNYISMKPIGNSSGMVVIKDMQYISLVDLEKRHTVKLFKTSCITALRSYFMEVSTSEEVMEGSTEREFIVKIHSLEYTKK